MRKILGRKLTHQASFFLFSTGQCLKTDPLDHLYHYPFLIADNGGSLKNMKLVFLLTRSMLWSLYSLGQNVGLKFSGMV